MTIGNMVAQLDGVNLSHLAFEAQKCVCTPGVLEEIRGFAGIHLVAILFLIFAYDEITPNHYSFKDLPNLNNKEKLIYIYNKVLIFLFFLNVAALVF